MFCRGDLAIIQPNRPHTWVDIDSLSHSFTTLRICKGMQQSGSMLSKTFSTIAIVIIIIIICSNTIIILIISKSDIFELQVHCL